MIKILQTSVFKKIIKKLHSNQKKLLDDAVLAIADSPLIGEAKAGDLANIRIYKFKMLDQITLLAYQYDEERSLVKLLALGVHENFYRDLKTNIKNSVNNIDI